MERYIIGYDIDGYNNIDIDSDELLDIKECLVVVVLGEESNGRLYSYYSNIRNLIINNNKIILLLLESKSYIRKQISMLLMSYRNYNIYTVDTLDIVDKDYINELDAREPSQSEVTEFIGADVTAYTELNEILLSMITSIKESDIDKLRVIIEDKRDSIEGFVDVIDYMKSVVDSANSGDTQKQIKSLRAKIDDMEVLLNTANKKLKQAEIDLENAKDGNEVLQREANRAKQRLAELEDQVNISEPVLRTYAELQTQMIKCKTQVILYFKEVSHVSYIASFVTEFVKYLTKLKKLRVKLLIYDNKHSFLSMYKPIQVIGSSEYIADRDRVVNKLDKLVIVEANQAIIEDILKSDWDVVVIYDRLRQVNDIVSGNNVYKYWVLNSIKEYTALSNQFKIDKKDVITNHSILPEVMVLTSVPSYSAHTTTAKLSAYMNMTSPGCNRSIFNIIENNTNIAVLKGKE